jgi:hypothetical protein
VESDVNATLSELERKLKELERELESVGRSGEPDADAAQAGWTPPVEPEAQREPQPGPPPAGVTPARPGPLPPPGWDGAPPAVPVPPPAAPWQAAAATWQAAPQQPTSPAPPAPPAPDAGVQRQLDELLAFRERLVQSTNELVAELSRLLTELGAEVESPAPAPPPDPQEVVFSGQVTVEAAPFADVATLADFERALAHTDGVAHVAVRTLDSGRATLDVTLAEPVALGGALRATAPVGFEITAAGDQVLALAIAPGAAAPPV